MGFFSSLVGGSSKTDILDPLDLGGSKAADASVDAAKEAAEIQREQAEIAQANLQPFLDASLAQIPGLERGATEEGFLSNLLNVRGSIPDIFRGVTNARGAAGVDASALAGITLGPEAISEIQQFSPEIQNALMFDIEQELNRRQQELFAPGTTAGTELSRLGSASATGIGNTLTQGLFDAQQSRSAGSENLAAIGGSIASFLTAPKNQQQNNVGFVDHSAGIQGPQPAR